MQRGVAPAPAASVDDPGFNYPVDAVVCALSSLRPEFMHMTDEAEHVMNRINSGISICASKIFPLMTLQLLPIRWTLVSSDIHDMPYLLVCGA